MDMLRHLPNKQRGVMLLEALIAILIFMIGILAIIGLQAAAIKNAGDAKYRSEASLLANQLIGQMLVSNRSSLAALQGNFQSPSGIAYTAWLAQVTAAGTGLPGASATPPTVNIAQTATTSSTTPSMQATIQIFWQAPNELVNHQYIAVAQIN